MHQAHALHHTAEDHVLAVQVLRLAERDEELRPVGVWTCAGRRRVSRRRAPARLRQPEPRMRLAVRGVPKGALRTHSA